MPNFRPVWSVALAATIVLVVAIVVTLPRSEAPQAAATGEVHPAVIRPTSESALARVSTPASAVTAPFEKADKITTTIAIPPPPVEDGATMLSRVQMALSNGTPEEALRAASTLSKCAQLLKAADDFTEGGVRGLTPKQVRQLLPEKTVKILDSMGTPAPADKDEFSFEPEVRQCQVFDSPLLAGRGELYARAYEGGALNSAGPYLFWLVLEAPSGQRSTELVGRLRAEVSLAAKSGELSALQQFHSGAQAMSMQQGFSALEHAAYREAYLLILEASAPGSSAALRKFSNGMDQLIPPKIQLTEQERLEANAQAEEILANFRNKQKG